MADHGDIHWVDIEDARPGDTVTCECENCEFETLLECYEVDEGKTLRWYCEVCANSFLSLATHRPDLVGDTSLYKSIGWIANRILDEVRKVSPAPGS